MGRLKTLASLLALCLPTATATAGQQAQADTRWSPLVQSEKGRILLDRSSLRRDGNLRTILVRAIPAADLQVAAAEVLMRFDCTGRSYAILRLTGVREDGSEFVASDTPTAPAVEPVGQDADTVALLEGVCAL